jgi:hypothetical protein
MGHEMAHTAGTRLDMSLLNVQYRSREPDPSADSWHRIPSIRRFRASSHTKQNLSVEQHALSLKRPCSLIMLVRPFSDSFRLLSSLECFALSQVNTPYRTHLLNTMDIWPRSARCSLYSSMCRISSGSLETCFWNNSSACFHTLASFRSFNCSKLGNSASLNASLASLGIRLGR